MSEVLSELANTVAEIERTEERINQAESPYKDRINVVREEMKLTTQPYREHLLALQTNRQRLIAEGISQGIFHFNPPVEPTTVEDISHG